MGKHKGGEPYARRIPCSGMEVLVGCPGEVGSRIAFNLLGPIICNRCGGEFTRWVLTRNKLEHRVELSRD